MSREFELIAGASLADTRPGPASAAAGAGPKHAAAHTECLNCGAALHGRFCAACGQAADDHHRSILALVWEWVQDLTHLDGRLARTLPPLFLRPGSLARDHFEGRRQRHVPPLRLFFVSLLIVMLALEAIMHRGTGARPPVVSPVPASSSAKTAAAAPSSSTGPEARTPVPPAASALPPPRAPEAPRVDTALLVPPAAATPSGAGGPADAVTSAVGPDPVAALEETSFGKSDLARLILRQAKKAGVNPDYFSTVVFEWAHRLAILLLPIFALLLTSCYFYRRRFYVYDHLVVAMQFLSFVFLVSSIAWLSPTPVRGLAVGAASVWAPVNLFMILRGAYGSSVIGAVVKTVFLWTAACVLFLMLLVTIIAVALGQMR